MLFFGRAYKKDMAIYQAFWRTGPFYVYGSSSDLFTLQGAKSFAERVIAKDV